MGFVYYWRAFKLFLRGDIPLSGLMFVVGEKPDSVAGRGGSFVLTDVAVGNDIVHIGAGFQWQAKPPRMHLALGTGTRPVSVRDTEVYYRQLSYAEWVQRHNAEVKAVKRLINNVRRPIMPHVCGHNLQVIGDLTEVYSLSTAERTEGQLALIELLRTTRAERRVKLEEAARVMNISREQYFLMEKGRLIPTRCQLDTLAKFYVLSPRIFDDCFR